MRRTVQPLTIGIDIGGTLIKMGLVRGTRVLSRQTLSTMQFTSPKALQNGLVDSVRAFRRNATGVVAGVGIGVPGLVRYPAGVVRTCANIPGWKDVPLKALLQKRLHFPVQVDNDVNVMTLAEWRYGAGRGVRDLVCMTLGTGVGGGLVLDGCLYRGSGGAAGEIGHMPLGEEGRRCSCGGRACLERQVGNREILQWVRQQLKSGVKSRMRTWVGNRLNLLTPELIDRAAALGDPLAQQTWERVGQKVGIVLAGVVNLLNPERIVVGGGISKAGRWLFKPMRESVRQRTMAGIPHVPIVPARLGSDAGLIGAALLAIEGTQ